MRNKTNKCIHKYVNLLQYKQHTAVNLHICICTFFILFLTMNHQCMIMNHPKMNAKFNLSKGSAHCKEDAVKN